MKLVDTETVTKQKELLVGTVKGAKLGQMANRATPEIYFLQGWL